MQRNNLNENSSQTDKPVKKRQADINLKTRTNLGFTFFDCGISGQGEVNQYTKDGKKAADVNFKLDKPDPNNSSLCYISLFTGYAHLLQTAPNKAHMKSTIDAGGVKTINLDQEVDFSKKKSADGTKNINSKFSVFTTQCELDVKVKKPQEGAETSRKNNLS